MGLISFSSDTLPGGVTSPGFGFAVVPNTLFSIFHRRLGADEESESEGMPLTSNLSVPWDLYAPWSNDGVLSLSKDMKGLLGDGCWLSERIINSRRAGAGLPAAASNSGSISFLALRLYVK